MGTHLRVLSESYPMNTYMTRLRCFSNIFVFLSLDKNSLSIGRVTNPYADAKIWENDMKPWHMGTHLRVLSESYPMNTNMTGLRCFSKIFVVLLCLDKNSLSIGRVRDHNIS